MNILSREEVLNQLKNDIYCRLKPSEHGGVGIFAIRDIPAGINPFVGTVVPNHYMFTVKELEVLHPNVKRLVQDMFVFKDGVYHVPDNGMAQVDIAYYVNHCDRPNLRVVNNGLTFETIREVKDGEELCADYASYNDKEDVFDR
ncbi:MAG: hypothetical protein ACD_72C00047G0001 [uncultured bacterium]|nr:MAG: hypothetical protein ACD_72C00047G0001 [uncultured bacterium]